MSTAVQRIKKWGAGAALCLVLLQPLALLVPAGIARAQGTGATASSTQQLPKQPDACAAAGLSNLPAAFACFIRQMYVFAFSIPIMLSSWLLALVGVLFNFLIEHVIIGFGSSIYGPIQAPLQAAWSTFRDLANILIVGMFVFIAISIILEIEEFGRKRLVVDVIIIAVLINFSLLFTKLAIDASNFVAYQFYNATLVQQNGSGGTAQASSKGIAEQFLDAMGVSSFADTVTALENVSKGPDINAGIIATHGIGSSVVLVGAAAIFLYGSFLISARAIIIILLLLFSSIAFASYLVPGKSRQVFGAWISELIGVVVFAPVLMLMLWATLQIARAFKATSGGGTLGSLMTNPTADQGSAMTALFSYVVIIGLLYATFAVANALSNKAKGTTLVSGKLRAGALAFGLAPFLRNTLGRGSAWAQSRLEGRAQGKMADAAKRRIPLMGDLMSGKTVTEAQKKLAEAEARRLERKAAGTQTRADLAGKLAGMKFGTGKSFTSIQADRAKTAEERAKKLKLTDEQQDSLRKEVLSSMKEQQKETLEASKNMAEATMNAVKESANQTVKRSEAEGNVKTARHEQETLEQAHQERETAHQANLKQLREEAAQERQAQNEEGVRQKEREMEEARAKHETERKAQNEKIQAARMKVTDLQRRLTDLDSRPITAKVMRDGKEVEITTSVKEASEALTKATQALKDHKSGADDKKLADLAQKAAAKNIGDTIQGVAAAVGRRQDPALEHIIAWARGAQTPTEAAMSKKFKHKEKSNFDEMFERMKKEMKEDNETREKREDKK